MLRPTIMIFSSRGSVETGGPQDPWLGFAFRKYHAILPNTLLALQPYVLAVHAPAGTGARAATGGGFASTSSPFHPEFLKDEASLTKVYNLKTRRQGREPL